MPPGPFRVCWHFYPRSPCGERPTRQCCAVGPVTISIHALLAESDRQRRNTGGTAPPYIYPRSPCGERRPVWSGITVILSFYPRSPCGERRPPYCTDTTSTDFYPRSPCGERPSACWRGCLSRCRFLSTLSLRRATINALGAQIKTIFLSTLSLRRATYRLPGTTPWACYFYPRSPCGERRRPA